jgi:hypothetical protein
MGMTLKIGYQSAPSFRLRMGFAKDICPKTFVISRKVNNFFSISASSIIADKQTLYITDFQITIFTDAAENRT